MKSSNNSKLRSWILALAITIAGTFGALASDLESHVLALDSSDPQTRLEAINALGALEGEGAGAILKLLELVTSEDKMNRVNAAWALGKIAPKDPRIVRAMATALQSGDPEVAYNASLSLQWAGESAKSALIDVLENGKDEWGVFYAAFVLSGLDEAYAAKAEGIYVGMFQSGDLVKARAGLEAMGRLSRLSDTMSNALNEGLRSDDESLRIASAYAAKNFGESARSFEALLIDAIRSETSRDPRLAAIEALGAVSKSAAALEVLVEMLYSDDSRTRYWASQGLGGFGSDAIPLLKKVIGSDNHDARMAGFDAISQLDALGTPFVDELISIYSKEGIDAQFRILYALWALGRDRKDVVDFISNEVENSDSDVVKAHARAIMRPAD